MTLKLYLLISLLTSKNLKPDRKCTSGAVQLRDNVGAEQHMDSMESPQQSKFSLSELLMWAIVIVFNPVSQLISKPLVTHLQIGIILVNHIVHYLGIVNIQSKLI